MSTKWTIHRVYDLNNSPVMASIENNYINADTHGKVDLANLTYTVPISGNYTVDIYNFSMNHSYVYGYTKYIAAGDKVDIIMYNSGDYIISTEHNAIGYFLGGSTSIDVIDSLDTSLIGKILPVNVAQIKPIIINPKNTTYETVKVLYG